MALDKTTNTELDSMSEPFVAAAVAAAKLYGIVHITTQLKISALNAQIVTARAGLTAQGFRPLTAFITELANKTNDIITLINKEALNVSKSSISAMRQEKVTWSIHSAHRKHKNTKDLQQNEADFVDLSGSADGILTEINDRYNKEFNNLQRLLNDIESNIKSASYLGSNCRIEAAHIDQYRADFEAVAENIENSAKQIKKIVAECQQLLRNTE